MSSSEIQLWKSLNDSIDTMRATSTQAAIDTATAALEKAKSAFAANDPNLAIAYERVAELASEMGDHAHAEECYRHALLIHNQQDPSDDPAMARIAGMLGMECEALGRDREACEYYEQAIPLIEQELGESYPPLFTLLNNDGLLRKQGGDLETAERRFLRALEIVDKRHGMEHQDQALVLNNLGNLYCSAGEFEAAEASLQRALGIREHLFGPKHPDVAQTLSNLAVVQHSKGVLDAASHQYRRALSILAIQAPLDVEEYGIVAENYATLLSQQGKEKEAADFVAKTEKQLLKAVEAAGALQAVG